MLLQEAPRLRCDGHVWVRDALTGETILDKHNAIHSQNLARAIARSLARDTSGAVFQMSFGNGGTFFNSSNVLVIRTPNTLGAAADLYSQTYSIQVDDQSVGTPVSNSVTASSSPPPSISSIVTVLAQLNVNEPAGQAAGDNITTNPEAPYVFDEIGLKTTDGLLLSHLIFNPIEKTANRAFLITYTLTMSVS